MNYYYYYNNYYYQFGTTNDQGLALVSVPSHAHLSEDYLFS